MINRKYILFIITFGILIISVFLFTACTVDTDMEDNDDDIEDLIDYETEINPEYHEIDWENTNVVSVDTLHNVYRIELNEKTGTIRPGNVITLKKDLDYYIIIVEDVKINGDIVELEGLPGDLCDIYSNTSINLSTERSTRDSETYTPVLIEYVDNDGQIHSYRNTRTIEENTRLTGNLWHYDSKDLKDSESHFILDNNIEYGFESNQCVVDIDLNLNMNFGGRSKVDVINSLNKRIASRMLRVSAEITGNVKSYLKLFARINKYAEYDKGEEIVKHNLLRPIYVTFTGPYGVPIQVVLSADLFRAATLTAEGEAELSFGYENNYSVSSGISWSLETEEITPFFESKFSSKHIAPTLTGKGEIVGKASIFPRIFIMLYNTIGASFDLAPFISTELSAGFSKSVGGSVNDYLSWNLLGRMGIDGRSALSVKLLNYEFKRYETGEINLIDALMFATPYDISLVGYIPQFIEPHQKTTLTFEVDDKNYILNSINTTFLPAIVNFKTKGGNVSTRNAFCKEGRVTVDWIPISESDVLTAFMCDKDGNVLAQVSVDANGNEKKEIIDGEENPDGIEEWRKNLPEPENELEVDLGLSVNWSGWNLGAESAQYPGGYYAYGEISPRTNFLNGNYEFWQPPHEHTGNLLACEEDYVNIGNITGTNYDAATVRLGYSWHIPTTKECRELIEKCNFYEYKFRGMDGVLIVSGINNKAIFVPNAGSYWSGWGIDEDANFSKGDARFWTSTFCSGYWPVAYGLHVYSWKGEIETFNRTCGYPIRPVKIR